MSEKASPCAWERKPAKQIHTLRCSRKKEQYKGKKKKRKEKKEVEQHKGKKIKYCIIGVLRVREDNLELFVLSTA